MLKRKKTTDPFRYVEFAGDNLAEAIRLYEEVGLKSDGTDVSNLGLLRGLRDQAQQFVDQRRTVWGIHNGTELVRRCERMMGEVDEIKRKNRSLVEKMKAVKRDARASVRAARSRRKP